MVRKIKQITLCPSVLFAEFIELATLSMKSSNDFCNIVASNPYYQIFLNNKQWRYDDRKQVNICQLTQIRWL